MATDSPAAACSASSAIGLGGLALAGVAAGCAPGGAAAPTGSAHRAPSEPTDFSFASWGMSEDATKARSSNRPSTRSRQEGRHRRRRRRATPTTTTSTSSRCRCAAASSPVRAQLDVAWLSSLAALGKLADLGAKAKGRGYTDAALTAGQFDGKQWACRGRSPRSA